MILSINKNNDSNTSVPQEELKSDVINASNIFDDKSNILINDDMGLAGVEKSEEEKCNNNNNNNNSDDNNNNNNNNNSDNNNNSNHFSNNNNNHFSNNEQRDNMNEMKRRHEKKKKLKKSKNKKHKNNEKKNEKRDNSPYYINSNSSNKSNIKLDSYDICVNKYSSNNYSDKEMSEGNKELYNNYKECNNKIEYEKIIKRLKEELEENQIDKKGILKKYEEEKKNVVVLHDQLDKLQLLFDNNQKKENIWNIEKENYLEDVESLRTNIEELDIRIEKKNNEIEILKRENEHILLKVDNLEKNKKEMKNEYVGNIGNVGRMIKFCMHFINIRILPF
ncbi:hypothetical protein PFFCH_03923 [Plasmodium falciparum FCH/4]|uniref:Uncharacterized protein n=1 Tax=Plasmodium falciparum FCH/4 TaxID=1036724 RepID=A0A024VJ62_PLAFA|nr:hypothetical protein PFFCH_03923 [Plasmodium falciparum FCH/4]